MYQHGMGAGGGGRGWDSELAGLFEPGKKVQEKVKNGRKNVKNVLYLSGRIC